MDSLDSSGASVSAMFYISSMRVVLFGCVAGRQIVFLFTLLIGNFFRILALNYLLISA